MRKYLGRYMGKNHVRGGEVNGQTRHRAIFCRLKYVDICFEALHGACDDINRILLVFIDLLTTFPFFFHFFLFFSSFFGRLQRMFSKDCTIFEGVHYERSKNPLKLCLTAVKKCPPLFRCLPSGHRGYSFHNYTQS